jgi:hypothetical protein
MVLPARESLRFKSMAASTLSAGITSTSALNHEYIDASVANTLEVRAVLPWEQGGHAS